MTRSWGELAAVGLCALTVGLAGCGGESDLEPGVPKDVGYVAPKMQPNTISVKGKPALGATEKDKKEAKEKFGTPPAEAATP
jgi:hypothetical protein